jgi:hypothetical protein
MTAVWGRCILHTCETIKLDRCDAASENRKEEIKMQTEKKAKMKISMILKIKTKGNEKTMQIEKKVK